MRRRAGSRHVSAAATLLAAATIVTGAAAPAGPVEREFLRRQLGFSQPDIARASRGTPVARTLAAPDSHEIAVAGLVRIRVSPQAFLARFRDIASFKQGAMVLQVGRFSDPPRAEDLAALTFEDQDIAAIRSCRPGKCDVKLSSDAMQAFRAEVNWSAPDYREQASALGRRMLLEYVQRYLQGGHAALAAYDDKAHPVRLADEFRALLDHAPYLAAYAPELRQYLLDYPRGRLAGTDDFVYWSKESFGLKPVVSLTHVVIYLRPGGDIVMATKDLYSSHYMEASLGLTVLGDASAEAGVPAVDVLYLNRSRADALRGTFGGLARGSVARRQRDAMEKEMRRLKARLEAAVKDGVAQSVRRP